MSTTVLVSPSSATLPHGEPDQTPEPELRLIPGERPTLAFVFNAPLTVMLAELNVEVITASFADTTFTGHVSISGSWVFVVLSPNLSEYEAEFFTRYLTARAYNLEMSPLPSPFEAVLSPVLEGVPA